MTRDELIGKVSRAIQDFNFDNYGYDDLDIDKTDPSLDIFPDLVVHIVNYLED